MNTRRTGIIDIGSNSVRLVIYEIVPPSAYRVIHEFKESARLSQRIGTDGALAEQDIFSLVRILQQFQQICHANDTFEIRAVATAAIRNAANSDQILGMLRALSGMDVQLLSGYDEARIGFIGVIRTMDIADGILVDIGGGSTEVSVFRNRNLVRSVSFPFGAVNTAKRFSDDGNFPQAALQSIRSMVEKAIDTEPWIREHPGMPLVGLGGTMRNLCKISQRRRKYSLPQTHNYMIDAAEMDDMAGWICAMPADKRKKIDGLSKDRFDIIVPGVTILQTIFRAAGASHYVVSGAGLRDGLFYEHVLPAQGEAAQILERSAHNLLALHPSAPKRHAEQVSRMAGILFDALRPHHGLPVRYRTLLQAAALLYRIGVSVNFYHYAKHSFYLIAHSRLDGLTHREALLCALIASYKTKKRTLQQIAKYRDILLETDTDLIALLGSLLQLAAALDFSETQPVALLEAGLREKELQLLLTTKHAPDLEIRETEALRKDFKKTWDVAFTLHVRSGA
ncbi:Ppx/GppA phosphatase family protein [Paenibacillus hamazuiensis]|uniref:Ppx/GppA phosphatase family protein n=1 Tax=Paenibacillus hamazuiensis TaxID=2936508 RepID=UPI00200BAA06|nr:Ppx/GppA phosphatase family protein [Paenibacillus hamazuiensis]